MNRIWTGFDEKCQPERDEERGLRLTAWATSRACLRLSASDVDCNLAGISDVASKAPNDDKSCQPGRLLIDCHRLPPTAKNIFAMSNEAKIMTNDANLDSPDTRGALPTRFNEGIGKGSFSLTMTDKSCQLGGGQLSQVGTVCQVRRCRWECDSHGDPLTSKRVTSVAWPSALGTQSPCDCHRLPNRGGGDSTARDRCRRASRCRRGSTKSFALSPDSRQSAKFGIPTSASSLLQSTQILKAVSAEQ
jgi:hypothetical protein